MADLMERFTSLLSLVGAKASHGSAGLKPMLGSGGFPGGVHPPETKITAGSPIVHSPLPPCLILPLKQHIGEICVPVVEVGERVLRGQKIARSQGYVSAPVHASTSGTVLAIEEHAVPHPSGMGRPCIIIEADGLDEADESLPPITDYRAEDPAIIRERIRLSGIVGLGGAVFPTFIKMLRDTKNPVETVILNGIECEPYLTCDHRVMLEHAASVVRGLDVIMHAVAASRAVIAIEDNKTDAVIVVRQAIADAGLADVEVQVLPTRYPQGGEKQLIQAVTGKQIPAGRLPMHIGVMCQNVGTTKAIHDAVCLGKPLIQRVVTVSGDAVPSPANICVRIGTPMPFLLAQCGLEDLNGVRLIHGGPMMGERLPRTNVPLVKSTNGILAMRQESLYSENAQEEPCIRCGHCVEVCPVGLVPNELAWHCRNDQFDRGQEYDLFDCIECGCCSYVCPSHIPLVHYFRYAKGQVAHIEKERVFSEQSKARSEARDNRLAREQAERAARRSKVRRQHAPAADKPEAAVTADKVAADKVAAENKEGKKA
ncbi:MAG: electron transport complex subunit RsxC [Mariprofundaceae bacterium]|nr:electron transport complex subunit RsxC [Mariprofundaceae bacterium]